MKMADAKQKRNEQLKRWLGSETDLEPPIFKKKKTKVKFDDGAVFLAACSSGDIEEVQKMLARGADINYANVDGLTALHQACIDDNVEMVKFLVDNGASINQPDNEGWVPLHAAASCGYLDIAEYIIQHGGNVGAVNSEGDTPLDIAEEESMEELLQNEINRQGIDIEAARKEEERLMLRDARQWLNSGQISDARHPKSGGTALHVAAAKGYVEVMKLLIQTGYDVNVKDFDGWTPLHAAAHWGKEEACRILSENLCDMDSVNKLGQTAFDVADEDILGYLEELQKKQNVLRNEKIEKKSPLIESTMTTENNQPLKSFKNKETLLIEQEKSVPHIESLEQEKKDEEDEGKKDESSCSSEEEEEEDSESEAETEKSKPSITVNNALNTSSQPAVSVASSPAVPANQVTPTSPVKKFPAPAAKISSPKDENRKDESPASWRLGLRKTGSYGALTEISASKEAQKDKDTTGVIRSASSPRLSSTLDNKEKEKDSKGTRFAYVTPTVPARRIASTSDIEEKENRDSAASLVRSGSYTGRRWEDDIKKNLSSEGLLSQNTPSYYRRRRDDMFTPSITSSTVTSSPSVQRGLPSNSSTVVKPSSVFTPSSLQNSTSNRFWAEDTTGKEKDMIPTAVAIPVTPVVNAASTTTAVTVTSVTGTAPTADMRERRRSYLTPVRDEESESQRKARSRQARQSRRSTQGVTLTDLQEAEKTIGRSRPAVTRTRETEEKEREEKEKQDKEKQDEKKESDTREDDSKNLKYSRNYDETNYRNRSTVAPNIVSSTACLSASSGLPYSTNQINRPNSLIGITPAYTSSTRNVSRENEKDTEQKEEKEGDDKSEDKTQQKSIRERRRPREKRRSTGVSFWTPDSDENEQDQQSDTEDDAHKKEQESDRLSRIETGSSSTSSNDRYGRTSSYSYTDGRKPFSTGLEKKDSTDYKKLYEQILAENEKLKAQLHDTNIALTEIKLQLEKATQRQERFADRSLLEMEKRERRALERRISEMEEELKMLPDLKADNQRLKDENGALIRVISKLSK